MFPTRARTLFAAFAAIGLLLATAVGVSAQNEGIADTRHNFSNSSGRDIAGGFNDLSADVADYGEICVYCHTPHGGQTNAPLWNRQFTTQTFVMYNDATGGSSDLNMTFANQPTGVSLACLSCHDGTIGIDVIINEPNASAATALNQTLGDIYTTGPDTLRILGTDLRNDHPISMVYDPANDPQFNTVAAIEAASLRLFDDPTLGANVVQCATCHNPHSQNETFLRIENGGSALCLTCHIK